MNGFFLFLKKLFILFLRKQMQSIHCKKKRENSQWVFGSKEMRFNQGQQLKHSHITVLSGQPFFDPN